MDRALKQRLVGAVILAALLVILVPEWLDGAGHRARYSKTVELPAEPVFRPVEELMGKHEPAAKQPRKTSPTTTITRSSINAWALQVGSFSQQANARTLRDKFRADGFPAYVVKKKDSYRVRIGPELDRSRIETLQKKILKEQNIKGLLVKHP